jgi:hypothetical protein
MRNLKSEAASSDVYLSSLAPASMRSGYHKILEGVKRGRIARYYVRTMLRGRKRSRRALSEEGKKLTEISPSGLLQEADSCLPRPRFPIQIVKP